MAKVPNALYRNIAENFNRLSRAHERYRRQTDRQTTDGRAIAYSEREREFTFAKNAVTYIHNKAYMYNHDFWATVTNNGSPYATGPLSCLVCLPVTLVY